MSDKIDNRVQSQTASGSCSLDDDIRALEALEGSEYISADYMRFRVAVARAQADVADRLAAAGGEPLVAGAAGKPLLDASLVPLDRDLLRRLLDSLCTFCAAADSASGTEDLERLQRATDKDAGLLEQLVRAACGPDPDVLQSLTRTLEIPVFALLLLGRMLAAPFMAAARLRLPERERGQEDPTGHCAVCGSPPTLSRLDKEEGHRFLMCELCGEEWEFPRLTCALCGCDEQDNLGILFISEEDPRWLETCETCKRAVKTVDERKLPDGQTARLLVEDVAGLYLDILAEKEGYVRIAF
ncbi:MAG: formate dehydrogenase accessory protein FdhE [bacterium]|nr:formate dehydrogenase accessory protein FdhE [bacterium]